MMGCYQVKRLIDEADRPDLLPFEAAGHVASCRECKGFADERVKLRGLLTSTARVSVPVNFDAALRERLRAVNARRSFSWFSPAGYARLGAATAVLFVAVFVAQYANLFSGSKTGPANQPPITAHQPGPRAESSTSSEPHNQVNPLLQGVKRQVNPPPRAKSLAVKQSRDAERDLVSIETDFSADGTVILVQGQSGEREIPIQRVSVGAQQLVYANAGRQPARNVGTTF